MFSVGFESVGLSFFRPKHDNIFARNVDCFRTALLQFFGSKSDIPSVGKGWERSSNILSSLVIWSNTFKSDSVKIPSIEHIKEEKDDGSEKIRRFYGQLSYIRDIL